MADKHVEFDMLEIEQLRNWIEDGKKIRMEIDYRSDLVSFILPSDWGQEVIVGDIKLD